MENVTVPKPKTKIIVGLPGSNFSSKFLMSWTDTLYHLWNSDEYSVMISPGESSFVTFARMKTLGLDILRGVDQKPFDGHDYDIFVTLDSDMNFTPTQFMQLLQNTKTYGAVAGYYMMDDNKHLAVVKDWDEDFFIENGFFQFLTADDIEKWKTETKKRYMLVDYVGMGFFACRKDVLDSIKYPYFHRKLESFSSKEGKKITSICSEDVAFCKNIKRAGFNIFIDTDLRIGHEKRIII
jgi:hypothetical protein